MRTRNPLYLVLSLFCLVFALYWRQQASEQNNKFNALNTRAVRLETSLQQLREALEKSKRQRIPDPSMDAAPLPAPLRQTGLNDPTPTASARNTQDQSDDRIRESDVALASVEHLIDLSAEERERLRKKFEIESEGQQKGESLQDILGEEKYQHYQSAAHDFRQKMRSEMLDAEVYTLDRKLSLSPEQEGAVRQILADGREQFFPIEESDNSGPSTRTRTIDLLAREQERQRWNAEKVRAVLSDDQYNKFLQLQAESAANRMHSSFLASAQQTSTP